MSYPPQYDPQQPPPYGPPQPGYGVVAPKSPAVGLLVSIFLPGVGSMMADRVGKGVGILIGYLVSYLLMFVLIGFIMVPAFWIWGLVAAYTDAQDWNREHGIIS